MGNMLSQHHYFGVWYVHQFSNGTTWIYGGGYESESEARYVFASKQRDSNIIQATLTKCLIIDTDTYAGTTIPLAVYNRADQVTVTPNWIGIGL